MIKETTPVTFTAAKLVAILIAIASSGAYIGGWARSVSEKLTAVEYRLTLLEQRVGK